MKTINWVQGIVFSLIIGLLVGLIIIDNAASYNVDYKVKFDSVILINNKKIDSLQYKIDSLNDISRKLDTTIINLNYKQNAVIQNIFDTIVFSNNDVQRAITNKIENYRKNKLLLR